MIILTFDHLKVKMSSQTEERCSNPGCSNQKTIVCSICSEPYCSLSCQDLDWVEHYEKCKKYPIREYIIPENVDSL